MVLTFILKQTIKNRLKGPKDPSSGKPQKQSLQP